MSITQENSTQVYVKTFKEFQKKGYTVVIQEVRGYYQVQERDGLDRREITTSATWLEALTDYVNILKTV